MRFLKKVSYQDIIRETDESPFYYYRDISNRLKELELCLTEDDLSTIKKNEESCLNTLSNKLEKSQTVIAAIYCSKSCNTKDVLTLAGALYKKQYAANTSDSEFNEKNHADKAIIVILHPNDNDENFDIIEKSNLQSKVRIAFMETIESCSTIDTEMLKNKGIGLCIDLTPILSSDEAKNKIKNLKPTVYDNIYLYHVSNYGQNFPHGHLSSFEHENDRKTVELIRQLCTKHENGHDIPITFEMTAGTSVEKTCLNYEDIIFSFSKKHVFGKFYELLKNESNMDLKSFFDELFFVYTCDRKSVYEITEALWKIKNTIFKNTVSPTKDNTLFGVDFDKTEVNLSLIRLKAYIYYTRFCNLGIYLANNYYNGENCIWSKEQWPKEYQVKQNWADMAAEDFGLSMKYFMFNDNIHQCVYTGIRFKFLIDFLPKKETFFRFNDNITSTRKIEFNGENTVEVIIKKICDHISGTTIDKDDNSIADFYSTGKNFGQCLFKYFDSKREDWSLRIYEKQPINYVLYDNKVYSIPAFTQYMLIENNSIKGPIKLSLDISRFAKGRDGDTSASLEGFLKYFLKEQKSFIKENVASISDGEILFTDLPAPSAKYTLNAIEGVILKTIFLKIISLKMNMNKEIIIPCTLNFIENSNDTTIDGTRQPNQDDLKALKELKEKIDIVNKNPTHSIWEILKTIQKLIDYSNIKDERASLEESKPYSGLNDKDLYTNLKNYINCNWKENANE
ncbi:hypothetical protein [Clostridium sp. AF32-12BH]|uniref:hypothetical protein n=1 Tax=Clostridium sp. AF32-12BH TaxID=2292006 RepID=UPI000E473FF3|nr:hypothetical protein [Clostridium sp. AF32-12BH]RHP47216.1 hypothetical protein DWZ40_07200 [Clostridium sp. AF32-12BH]